MDLLDTLKYIASAAHGEAHALPFAAFRDDDLFAMEMNRVFHDDWVFACAEHELASAGDYYALRLGGEPVVVLRGKDGEVRALSNVCRHRGTQLLDDGFGRIDRHIVCPYHAWAYDDEGRLSAVPFAREIAVDRATHGLTRFATESWHGLVFINLGTAPVPLSRRLDGVEGYLGRFEFDRFVDSASGPIEVWEANWKLVVENAIESYHLFKVHKDTLETVTPTRDAYYVAGGSEWSLAGGRTVLAEGSRASPAPAPYAEVYNHYLLIAIPPSFVGVLGYDDFAWLSAHPVDTTTTVIRSGGLAADLASFEDSGSQAFTRAFFAEDKAICERVQRTMGTTRTTGGPLVDMERIVVDFHRYLASRLFGTPALPIHVDPMAAQFLEVASRR